VTMPAIGRVLFVQCSNGRSSRLPSLNGALSRLEVLSRAWQF
jgi:hypothetical protein